MGVSRLREIYPVHHTTVRMNELKKIWKAYLKGNASKEEKKRLLDALENKGLENDMIAWMRENWEHSSLEIAQFSNDDRTIYENLKRQITAQEDVKNVRPLFHKKWLQYAAAACVAGLLALAVWWSMDKGVGQPQWTKLEVQAGEPAAEFVLPDGSKIWLNAATTLQFDFSKNRQLILEGEAYFEVAKNKDSPFQVRFGNNELLVTGTQFNIKAYPNETDAEVHVREGSVSVFSKRDTSLLIQNDYLEIGNISGEQLKSKLAYSNLESWTTGQLVFKNAPIEEVIHSLERHYDIHISLQNPTARRAKKLTVTYPKDTKLKDVLEGLRYLQGLDYEIISPDSLIIQSSG